MIEVRHLNKTFHLKSGDVAALEDVSFRVEEGSVYGVIGYSGAGKSTLVRCLNLLEYADSGEIEIGGRAIVLENGQPSVNGRRMTGREQSALRRGIGMIFQHFNLLDRLTVFDNIAYPLKHTGRSRKEIEERVTRIMKICGIEYFMTTKLAWNQFNKMPYDTFMWRGIDGTEILSHLITTLGVGQPVSNFFTTYNGMLHPDAIMGGWERRRRRRPQPGYAGNLPPHGKGRYRHSQGAPGFRPHVL